jgi:glutamyl-tRNA synthetase
LSQALLKTSLKHSNGLGIEFDEGPFKGDPFGPYIQSQRLELYHKHALELVEKGYAYYCFCSPERLEKMRQEQIKLDNLRNTTGHVGD